jgi:hypothetical protein
MGRTPSLFSAVANTIYGWVWILQYFSVWQCRVCRMGFGVNLTLPCDMPFSRNFRARVSPKTACITPPNAVLALLVDVYIYIFLLFYFSNY